MSKESPAFPSYDGHNPTHVGMTLRQWYAGQALAGLLSNSNPPARIRGDGTASIYAAMAFEAADAMLAQETKETDQ